MEDTLVGQKILQLEGNTIPLGPVPLEILFNKNDVASKPMALEMDEQVEDCNIVSEDEAQMVRISKGIPSQYKHMYLNLFKIYKHKLGQINPSLLPYIEK